MDISIILWLCCMVALAPVAFSFIVIVSRLQQKPSVGPNKREKRFFIASITVFILLAIGTICYDNTSIIHKLRQSETYQKTRN